MRMLGRWRRLQQQQQQQQRLPVSPRLIACFLLLLQSTGSTADCIPPTGCSVALGYYVVSLNDTVESIASKFQTSISSIQQYNNLPNIDSINSDQPLSIPFPCGCSGNQLGHTVSYTIVAGDTVDNVVHTKFSNLSQTQWVLAANKDVDPNNLSPSYPLTIPFNCSCGNPDVSMNYGMFLTYVVQDGDTLTTMSQKFGIQTELLQKYNQNVNMNGLLAYMDIIFTPAKGQAQVISYSEGPVSTSSTYSVGKPMEFTYEQLAEITDDFNISKQIGAGAFGAVYYGEINKTKVAIKKMDIKEAKQFMAEVQVLAHVHHTNLVHLVGYCKADALFLVYEFVENGTLRHHLEAFQRRGGTPLTWTSRIQVALDTARALEYIHEHTVPSYVHLDIKPENILLDNSLRAKVADFGLAKLSEAMGTITLGGTPGYMAPEYAQYGEISPKVDVFSFGVVLMQLISAKGAIITMDEDSNRRSLPSLFEDFLKDSEAKANLSSFIDPALKDIVLQDSHTLNSMWKMTQLAANCTNPDPTKRPNMRAVVSSLTSLLHPSQGWGSGTFNVQANYSG